MPCEKKINDSISHGDREPSKKPLKEPSCVILEIGGPKGLEPTRFGDWEKNGRCSDF